jgi:folate-binding protein YgfZ
MSDIQTAALRGGAGAFLTPRDVIAVHGADAESYLQGQLSQDVVALGVGETADSLLLHPDGKLSALLRVTRTGAQGYLLDVDAGFGDAVTARLRKFLLRSKVEMERLPWRCLSLRGAAVDELAAGLRSVLAEAGVLELPFAWGGWTGVDLLGPRDLVLDPFTAAMPPGIVSCEAEVVDACRIASGIPAMGAELTDKTIAAEAGLVERTVSFTKGCYTGQELVARLDARGNKVARRLIGLVAEGSAEDETTRLAFGMTVHAAEPPGDDDPLADKVVGTVTSGSWSSELGAWVALGYLHRSIDVPGPVRVRSGDGLGAARPATARPLPLVTLPASSTG